MSEPLDPREQLRELAESLNVPYESLLASMVEITPPSAAPQTLSNTASLTISEAAIRAAISDSFSPGEVHAADADHELLKQSEVIMIGGRRRLRLSDSARLAILRDASSDERYGSLLNQAIASDREKPVDQMDEIEARSACLRRFLTGDAGHLESASPAELRAAVAALERLRGITLPPGIPTLAQAQRLLERAELLEPLRISIGATGDWSAVPSADRFVGREKEMKALRAFVDEIESQGKIESVQRGIQRANQTVQRRLGDERAQGIRLILARGGLGKSALIAKFVLDHALRQRKSFPFAYLDFDRAAIQARDPRQLLLEVARQVALQFPDVAKELGELREAIRRAMSGLPTSTLDTDPFNEFRRIVRRVTLGERALLVVLDTVEIIQSDALAVSGVLAFLERLSRGGLTELRIVVAGRADVPELLAGTNSRHDGVRIPLEPLSEDEARDMVQRLANSLMASQWKTEWTLRVAGKKTDPPERREPLSLRVAVEAMRDEKPQNRDRASLEIERLGEEADTSFVGKLYQSRVLEHVGGGRDVRQIAWPGLVVRRVSTKIIRELLAPHCGLDPQQAQAVFDALATQVWIVQRDGDYLQHQPDLRARTLPLMRRYDPRKFKEINDAAIEYFGTRRSESPQNHAEWLYHRLLAGESPDTVDTDWNDAMAPLLKGADEDFRPGTLAGDYLAARTSDRPLPDDRVRKFAPRLALLHIARTSPQKGSLAERLLDPVLADLALPDIPTTGLSEAAVAARTCLLIKTGRWGAIEDSRVDVEGPWQHQLMTAVAFRRARTSSPDNASTVAKLLMRIYSATGAMERSPLGMMINDLSAGRIHGLPITDLIDAGVARRLGRGPAAYDATLGLPLLRTTMLFGYRAIVPATQLWIAQVVEQLRAGQPFAFSARELHALSRDDDLISVVRTVLKGFDQTWEDFLSVTTNPSDHTRLDDPALGPSVCDALRRRCESAGPDDLLAIRRFAAARDEDWVVPMAYAAYRANTGRIPKEVADLYETHQPVARGFIRRNVLSRTSVPSDIVEVLRRADEASDIAGGARVFAGQGDDKTKEDLRALLRFYTTWRTGVDQVVDPPMA